MSDKLNINEQVQMILDIANQLRGPFKEDEYQNVIIPMTICRRFECILEDTKDEVLKEFEAGERSEKSLKRISGYSIYNTSKFTLSALLNDPNKIKDNFKDYLNAFNGTALTIFTQMKFFDTIEQLDKGKKLYVVIKKFANTDLSVNHVSSMQMGYIMEEIIRTYSENASAGDHFTPREVIRCLTQLLLAEGCDDLYEDGKIVTLADFACGTGGMLSEGYRLIKELNSDTKVTLFGQDNNGWYEGIAQAEMIIKGQNPENIKLVTSTLTTDPFPEQKVRLILMNPPFGLSYAKKEIGDDEYKKIVEQNKKGGWYEGGLPATGDSQMLFWQYALNKLDDNGRAAIICNASPLFSGGSSSGESSIRKWIFENDWVEAIIQFCPELFYNTGISIYSIILNKNKSPRRRGKIQLINASSIFTRMNKGLGFKRNKISEEKDNNQISQIVKLYADFDKADPSMSKIFTKEDFYYREVVIQQPFQRNFKISLDRIENLNQSSAFNKLYDEDKYQELDELASKTQAQLNLMTDILKGKEFQERIVTILNQNQSDQVWLNKDKFSERIVELIPELSNKKYSSLLKGIVLALSEHDENADTYKNKKGIFEADSELKDTELIPFKENIHEYFNREVKPFLPLAWMEDDEDSIKIGCEINFNKYFYVYREPESSDIILERLKKLSEEEKKLESELYD